MAMNTTAQTLVEIDKLLSEKVVQNISQLKSIIDRLNLLKKVVESAEEDQNAILSVSSNVTWESMQTMIDELTDKVSNL